MAINFPANPNLNDTFTVGNTNYVWDGTKWTASVTGGIALDKIQEGNTSAEVVDTGSDGRFVVNTEGVEALRVDNQQRVGIGTPSPNADLHVKSADVASIKVESGGTSDAQIDLIAGNNTNPFSILTNTSRDFIVQDLYTERLRISSTGAVALNATANYGTSGQVLTSQGSGAAPQWATPGGGWTFISSVTASNSSSVALTSGLDSTYTNYAIIIDGLFGTIDNTTLWMRVSTNGGSSYLSTNVYNYSSVTTGQLQYGLSQAEIVISRLRNLASGGLGVFTIIYLIKPNLSSTGFVMLGMGGSSGATVWNMKADTVISLGNIAVNAIQFLPSTGAIDSGNFSLYGLSN